MAEEDQNQGQDQGAGNGDGGSNEPELPNFWEVAQKAAALAQVAGDDNEIEFWSGAYGPSVLVEDPEVGKHLEFLRAAGPYGEQTASALEKHISATQAEAQAELEEAAKTEQAAIDALAATKLAEERAAAAQAKRLEAARQAILDKEAAEAAAAAGAPAGNTPADQRMDAAGQLVDAALEVIEAQPGSEEAYVAAKKATDALEEAESGSGSPVGVNVDEFLSRIDTELEEGQ